MKRIYLALSLILCAAFLSGSGYFLTKKSVDPLIELLEEIIYKNTENGDVELEKKAEKVIEKWYDSQKILTILLKHNTTLLIDEKMKILKDCIDGEDKERCGDICFEIHASLKALLESEKLSLKNVL